MEGHGKYTEGHTNYKHAPEGNMIHVLRIKKKKGQPKDTAKIKGDDRK
jgi:hypothetical protein